MTGAVSLISERLNHQSAVWYASRGFFVFPLYEISRGQCACHAASRCPAPGKHPRTAHGYKDATTDVEEIRKWFAKWPGAGVGIAAGLSGLVILDIDPRNRGDESLRELPELPRTPRVLTGGGGVHYYFRKPAGGDFDGFVLAQGIDVKSDGGYIVAPPSLHIQGQYRSDPDAPLDSVPLAELPDWVIQRRKQPKKHRASSGRVSDGFVGAAFEAAGWLGKSLGSDKTAARCPWETLHTSGKTLDGSTVVFAPVDGSRTGWAHCSHSHCAGRTLEEWIAQIPDDAKTAARERLGMDQNYQPRETEQQPATAPDARWLRALCFDNKGLLTKEPGNVGLLLANDEPWRGCLAYDEFRCVKQWVKQPPFIEGLPLPKLGQFADQDITYIQQKLKLDRGTSFPPETVRAGVDAAARELSYHPVQDYLLGISWDTSPRISRWLSTYLGVPDTAYARLISKWWMLSAVARVFRPGCKADSILILEGPQGTGKSTALRILGDPWFADTPIDISSKDSYLSMRGKWIIELAELESISRAEANRIKAFFTGACDTYRPPYGHETLDVPRQCVFAGTVNHNEYLHDETGGRRFWPVACGGIRLEELARDRDQLWAEAFQMYSDGIVWWPSNEKEAKLCGVEQSNRYVSDEWESVIANHIRGKSGVAVAEILSGCFGLQSKDWTRGHEMRVAKCLKRLGYEKSSKNHADVRRWHLTETDK